MESAKVEQPVWTPRTKLGMMVAEGKITSLEQIFENGWRIKEPMIVKTLLPDLKTSVVGVGIVQKQTDAGEITRFSAVVAVGNENGWLGVGKGKASHMRIAIEKATNEALLNIIPVRLSCGSWECRCGNPHSIPYKVEGKSGSVRVVLIPGPRGLGLV
ncbi:MAG: 30S ribosomal protein S5, partial [Nitrososphaerales archaeon]|nr:30S ribosomal protein S5 [Nitrososphaerales archaeon]